MADLTYIQATGETKIVGQDSTGNQVNQVAADSSGNMLVKPPFSSATAAAVPASAAMVGGSDGTNLRALATDSAGRLVPISPLDTTSSANLTALNQAVTLATNGRTVAIVQVTGTFSATVQFEGSVDGGTTYFSVYGIYLNSPVIPITNLASTGQVSFYVGGYSHLRARISSYTSGTAAVLINGATGTLTDVGTQIVRLADNVGSYLTSTTDGSKQRLDVTASSKNALTPSSPTVVSVGVTSASAVAANASRKGLVLINTSTAKISFGLNTAAVLNSGITLYPGGVWEMDEYTYTTVVINAIASIAVSTLSVQEFA